MSNGWDSYIWRIQNTWSDRQTKYTMTNVASAAAIYGIDGSCWACSADWPGLNEYDHDQEMDDGSTKNIRVNEFACALGVSKGTRKPSAAGCRMGGQKYLMTTHDAETNVAMLTRTGGGGGTVAKTKNAIIIGIWDKTAMMSNNKNQNAGDCAMNVEKVHKLLTDAGY